MNDIKKNPFGINKLTSRGIIKINWNRYGLSRNPNIKINDIKEISKINPLIHCDIEILSSNANITITDIENQSMIW